MPKDLETRHTIINGVPTIEFNQERLKEMTMAELEMDIAERMNPTKKKKAKPANAESWNTPKWLFNFLNEKYNFTLDAAASEKNTKCANFYSKENSAFGKVWRGNVFLNPPYGDKEGPSTTKWIEEAFIQCKTGNCNLVCLVIPLKPDTNYYHDYIRYGNLIEEDRFEDPRGKIGIYQEREGFKVNVEVYEFRSRIPFEDDEGNTAGNGWFASCALVFKSNT